MESTAWPKAIKTTTNGNWSQRVPSHHPRASLLNCMLAAMGAGGRWTFPRTSSVMGAQISSATSITVVI